MVSAVCLSPIHAAGAGVFFLSCSEGEQISFLFDCIVRGITPSRAPHGLRPSLPGEHTHMHVCTASFPKKIHREYACKYKSVQNKDGFFHETVVFVVIISANDTCPSEGEHSVTLVCDSVTSMMKVYCLFSGHVSHLCQAPC